MASYLVHPEDGMTYACPNCDHSEVRERTGPNTHLGDPEDPYACYECSTTFEDPVERHKKGGPGGRSKLERLLTGGEWNPSDD